MKRCSVAAADRRSPARARRAGRGADRADHVELGGAQPPDRQVHDGAVGGAGREGDRGPGQGDHAAEADRRAQPALRRGDQRAGRRRVVDVRLPAGALHAVPHRRAAGARRDRGAQRGGPLADPQGAHREGRHPQGRAAPRRDDARARPHAPLEEADPEPGRSPGPEDPRGRGRAEVHRRGLRRGRDHPAGAEVVRDPLGRHRRRHHVPDRVAEELQHRQPRARTPPT